MRTDDKKRYLILKDPNILKGLIILSIPLMINNLIKTIHDVVDMFFVSRIPGYSAESVSSISITFPIVFTFISLGMGLSVAGTALISQYVGSAQYEVARKYASNLVIISLIVGLLLNIISFFGAPYIMKAMGTSGYLFENSVRYLQIRSFELPIVFLFFAFTAIRQSSGDTITPVLFGVVTIVINIILSPVLIQVYDMGVSGAAYATLIANIAILPFVIIALSKSKSGITISREYLLLKKKIAKDIIKLGVPASTGQAITAIGFGLMTTIIISYGVDTVAAFSVGNRLASLILHPVMAMGAVVAAYIGQNIGNLNEQRAKDTFKRALVFSFILMIVGSAIVMPFRETLAGFFIKDNNFALSLTVEYMFYLLIGLPLMAIFQTFIGTYNGTGNTKYTFIIGVTRLWVLRIPLIYIFKAFTDLESSGIWYAMLTSNLIIVFVGYTLFKKVDFKPKINI